MRITWIGQEATSKSINVDALSCLNMYPEIVESRQGKTPVALMSTPGLVEHCTLTGAEIRGMYVTSQGRLFVVCGATLYEVYADGTSDNWGTLTTAAGHVAMTDNGIQLFVTDGPKAYTHTFASGVFATIADVDFLGATHVGFLDGYFVCLRPNSQQIFWSDLYASTFTGTNIAAAEGNPDQLVAMLIAHREIWLFGRRTTELWYSTGLTGGAGAAFARIAGALLEYGCLAASSPAIVGDSVCWLAANHQGDGIVVQASGTTPMRISTHTMEQALRTYTTRRDAVGWGHQYEGHLFYWLTFPAAGVTWVYDASAGVWHQRASYDGLAPDPKAHLAYQYAFAHAQHYVGAQYSGTIYRLESTSYTDAGLPIQRQVTLPPLFDPDGGRRLKHRALFLDVESGTGLDGVPVVGQSPAVTIAYSDDGGHLWTPGQPVPVGALGTYRTRVRLTRLGSSRDRRYRITFTEPCRWTILGAMADVEPLAS
jgi:hypothetical protein